MQTKKESLKEAVTNILFGLLVALLSQVAFFYFAEIKITPFQNLALVFWMTLVSLVRSYLIRRWYNKKSLLRNV